MAVIGQIRKHSGLLVVIIGVALAAFVLGDFIKPSQNRPTSVIGEIDGTEIPAQSFNDRVAEQLQNRRDQQQSERITPQDEFQIRQQVWNQLIEEVIMGNEFEIVGLAVTKEELSNEILGEQPNRLVQQSFRDPNSGTFNPEVVRNFLQNLDQQNPDMKRRYLSLERMVKDDIIKTKYRNLLSKNYHIPEAFAKLDHQTKNKSADVRFVAPKYAAVADSLITITDSDLRSYYEEFQYNYKQEETRTLDYVIFEVQPSAEDRQAVKNEIDQIYTQFQNTEDIAAFVNSVSDVRYDSTYRKEAELPVTIARELMESPIGTILPPFSEGETHYVAKIVDRQLRPDSIKMSQLLISFNTASANFKLNERTEDQAKALADSILNALKKTPVKFEELAVKYSDYPSAKEDKGDLGWITDGDPSFANFFKEGVVLKVNEAGKMETGLGIHILLVAEKTNPVDKVKVGLVTRTIEPSSETFREIYRQASKFASENRTLAQFDTAVVNQGLNKRTTERINKMTNRIPGIELSSRRLVQWAFWENTKVGDVSSIFEDEKLFVIAALRETRPEGSTPFDQVKEQIRPLVLNRLKGEYLTKKINDMTISDLGDLARQMNERVDTARNLAFSARNIPGFGSEPAVIGKIFTLEPQKVSAPIAGNTAVFVAIVDRLIPASETADLSTTKFQLKNSFDSRVNANAYLRALEKEVKIEDNRMLFY
ncbi:MAG: SurA N-terminal domain-containing protein [Bacteroidales bacterium]|nr:SurA N-terminal domain-containing protein [Bacteroidales bacterium]